MKCKRCGRNNPDNAARCAYCNTPLTPRRGRNINQSRGQGNGTDRIIIFVIAALVAALAVLAGVYIYHSANSNKHGFRGGGGGGGGGTTAAAPYHPDFDNEDPQAVLDRIAQLNGGALPEITYDDEGIPSFIDGPYSNVRVTSYITAVQSLYDLKGLMRMDNPQKEYIGADMYETENHRFYRLQQVSNQVPVYGKQAVVETNMEGSVESLSCDYDPEIAIDTTPQINIAAAEQKALEYSEGNKTSNTKLYVYTQNGEPVLVWAVDCGTDSYVFERILVSAADGSLVDVITLAAEADAETSAADMRGDTRSFRVWREGGGYVMKDRQYGIEVEECGTSDSSSKVTSTDNSWSNAAAVSVMANLQQTIDYYINSLKSSAFSGGKLRSVNAYVNYRPSNCATERWYNATSSTDTNNTKTTLRFGNADNFAKCFDVLAHEFTHSVVSATCDLEYINQSGALNESYADIIGNLLQNEYYNTEEWEIGEELDNAALRRSMSSPNEHNQPEKVGGRYMHDYCHERHRHNNCDNGGVHTNSGIMNKAAYLMYTGGINNRLELATLFARSMDYMTPTSNFVNCRAAVVRASRDMGMDSDKTAIILNAFENVGIVNNTMSWISYYNNIFSNQGAAAGVLSGKVADAASRRPIADAQIVANSQISAPISAMGMGSARSDAEGNFSMNLPAGAYTLIVRAPGYMACTIGNVNVVSNETTYLENTILLTEVNGNPVSQAGGKVTNAVSGEPVEGAQIRFRSGWGSTSGDYVKNSRGGDIVLTTNSDGMYYTADLPYGYYTAEAVKEGYALQYVNIVSSNIDETALNQNIVLSPEASGNDYRITLEWGSDPRDEDSHIVGNVPGDFHVYYMNKTATFGGETIATLDHDDVNGNGFETVTVKADAAGTYRYYVHHYAGNGSLATSNAIVKVYRGNVMVKQYNVPVDQGGGIYWHVFDIINGEVVTVNRITNSSER